MDRAHFHQKLPVANLLGLHTVGRLSAFFVWHRQRFKANKASMVQAGVSSTAFCLRSMKNCHRTCFSHLCFKALVRRQQQVLSCIGKLKNVEGLFSGHPVTKCHNFKGPRQNFSSAALQSTQKRVTAWVFPFSLSCPFSLLSWLSPACLASSSPFKISCPCGQFCFLYRLSSLGLSLVSLHQKLRFQGYQIPRPPTV